MTDINNEEKENQEQLNSESVENLDAENLNDLPESSRIADKTELKESEEAQKVELQVNEEALKEQNQLFESYKKEVEDLRPQVETIEEIKSERKNMAELKEKILSLFLIPKSDRDNYIDIIQTKFEKLKETSDRLKNEEHARLEDNLKKIEPKIHSVLKEAENPQNFSDIRKKLIELQIELKDYEIHRDKKDDFFSLMQKAFESLNEKQDLEREKYEMEISENYLNVKPKVADAIRFAVQTDNYNKARERLIECQNELKKLKLKKDHLDELFGLIRKAFENVNQKQDMEREKLKAESLENFNEIKPVVEEAIKFATETDEYEVARKKLIDVQKEIKEKTLTRNQRDELYGSIREVFSILNEKQDSNREEFLEECNANYARLEVSVNEAAAYIDFTNDLNSIREGLLAVQDEVKIVKLTRAQRNELFKRIRLGFSKFDEKRNDFIKSRKQHQKSNLEDKLEIKKEKLTEVESDSLKEKIKNEIASTEKKIHNIDDQLDKLEE